VSGVVELRPVLNFSDCPAPEATQPALGLGDETPSTGSAPDTSVEPTGFRRPQAPPADSIPGDTLPADTLPDGPVDIAPAPTQATVPGAELLPTRDGSVLCVGPAQGTGEVFETGSAQLTTRSGMGRRRRPAR
jgi:hypothetical protein